MDTTINNIHLLGNQKKHLAEVIHPSIKGLSYKESLKRAVCVSEAALTPTDISEITALLNGLPNTPMPHISTVAEQISALDDRVTALENA